MKKFFKLSICFFSLITLLMLSGCFSDDTSTETGDKVIEGVTFADKTVEYTAEAQKIEVSGTIPTGVTAVYTNNEHTNVGEYSASVVLSGAGYITLNLSATLTITEPTGETITGLSMEDTSFTYDGTVKKLAVNGNTNGFDITYSNNDNINAGVYEVTAVITKDGYIPLRLSAELTINKAVISGITFPDKEVVFDESEHSVLVEGNIPTGVTVKYEGNTGTNQGVYNAKATLTGVNYETLVLETTLTIKANLANVAYELLKAFTNTPDPFSYLPESFSLENRQENFGNIQQLDYSNFVNTSSINQGYMGKQMNVLYDTLLQNEVLLKYVNTFNMSLNAVTIAYQNFINKNPDDYSEFSDTEGSFRYTITLNENDVLITVQFATVSLELEYIKETQTNIARIQLSDSNALKYESTPSSLTLAVNILNRLTSILVFSENNGVTQGVLQEFTNINLTVLKSTAYIAIDSSYTTVICNKRESNDLVVEGDVEVYQNSTGLFLGSEIKETVSKIDFDTYWFNLSTVGITSVKSVLEGNKEVIYINNRSSAFENKKIGGFGLDTLSRRFDIEFKTVYAYEYDSENDSYSRVELTIPMIFVQTKSLDTFVADMNEVNGVSVTKPTSVSNVLTHYYDQLIDHYVTLKAVGSQQEVIDYIGTKRDF